MTQQVSASVPIRVARQNYYATLAIDIKGSLSQAYDPDSGTVTPDWKEEANRPVLTPKIVCATAYSLVSYEWYRDGTLIASTSDGSVDNETYTIDRTTGALTICKNLVSDSNLDPDTFECKATIKVDNINYTMRRSVSATLLPLSSNGYVVLVTANSTALDSTNTSTVLTAEVYYGGKLVTSGLQYQWYKGGTAISGATNAKYTVSRDDVDWEQYYRVIVKDASGNIIGIGGTQVTDQADNYALLATIDGDVDEEDGATIYLQLRQRKSADAVWKDLAVAADYTAALYDVADTDTNDKLKTGTLSDTGYGSFIVTYAQMKSAKVESGMVEVTATW